jgi:A/G-specific adenine glycosylase
VRRLRRALLDWADGQGRHFFWREPTVTPFEVLVTEILLAKTQADMVAPLAIALLARYPDPVTLAGANLRDLQRLLYPLGLHRKRARHLKACARVLVERYEGVVPETIEELIELPFVGRYAASSIACVAFGRQVAVLDANVSRIYQRVFSLPAPPPRLANAHDLWAFAGRVLPRAGAKQFNWAILDLGGTICVARNPACMRCPIAPICDFQADRRRGRSRRALPQISR